MDEWLPQRHLARLVVAVIEGLDLSALATACRGSGSASYHPSMLLALLLYGNATQVFSSRAIERATCDSVAFRYIAGNERAPARRALAVPGAWRAGAARAASTSARLERS